MAEKEKMITKCFCACHSTFGHKIIIEAKLSGCLPFTLSEMETWIKERGPELITYVFCTEELQEFTVTI